MERDLLSMMGVALLAGVLIGLERQTAIARAAGSDEDPAVRTTAVDIGGVRTFPLIALAGALCALLAAAFGGFMPAVGLVALVLIIGAQRVSNASASRDAGLTTEAAAVVTFLLGVLAGTPGTFADLTQRTITVTALAVVVALLLSVKERLHAFSARIQGVELLGALQLLVVAVVIVPLLPDQGFGPYLALNPAHVGRMVLLVGVIGFIGFSAVRVLGTGRGVLVGGLVGGLVSSTAVAFSMARRARETPEIGANCALAIIAASAVMLVRVGLVATLLYPPLAWHLGLTLAATLVGTLVAALPVVRASRTEAHATGGVQLKNPFELRTALLFGVAFALVILASRFLQQQFGDAGLYVAAAAAGLTDVDGITLSTASLAREGLRPAVAVGVILTACLANTAVKAGIAWVSGGRALGMRVASVLGVGVITGVLALLGLAFLG